MVRKSMALLLIFISTLGPGKRSFAQEQEEGGTEKSRGKQDDARNPKSAPGETALTIYNGNFAVVRQNDMEPVSVH